MTQYRTADGKIFTDENLAIAHAQIIDFNNNGGFEQFGKPYEYSKVDRSEDGGETWR